VDWIVAPDSNGGALCDVLPSLLGAMGTPGFDNTLGVPACRSACALLIDGLGWSLLRRYAADAPRLAALVEHGPVRVGFPATTATSITSLGSGRAAGQHGIVGYTFAEPGGGLMNPLLWARRGEAVGLLEQWPPEQVQPHPTVFERAAAAGVRVPAVAPGEFDGSGLTRAGLRGSELRGTRAIGDLVSGVLDALSRPGPVLCYGYHGQLDHLGHIHGPGSMPWRMQLRQVDQLVASLIDNLPDSAVLAVVADHGMVELDPATNIDYDREPDLQQGVRLLGGELRARYLYTEPGAAADVQDTWNARLGQRGAVVTAERAIDEGWFGPRVDDAVRPRIGDLIAVLRDIGIGRSDHEPVESRLRGHHGSLTAEEQLVPVLVAEG
jgi:predicted AlkP superfamily pyrophosphatase or phosphodiesterase